MKLENTENTKLSKKYAHVSIYIPELEDSWKEVEMCPEDISKLLEVGAEERKGAIVLVGVLKNGATAGASVTQNMKRTA